MNSELKLLLFPLASKLNVSGFNAYGAELAPGVWSKLLSAVITATRLPKGNICINLKIFGICQFLSKNPKQIIRQDL